MDTVKERVKHPYLQYSNYLLMQSTIVHLNKLRVEEMLMVPQQCAHHKETYSFLHDEVGGLYMSIRGAAYKDMTL